MGTFHLVNTRGGLTAVHFGVSTLVGGGLGWVAGSAWNKYLNGGKALSILHALPGALIADVLVGIDLACEKQFGEGRWGISKKFHGWFNATPKDPKVSFAFHYAKTKAEKGPVKVEGEEGKEKGKGTEGGVGDENAENKKGVVVVDKNATGKEGEEEVDANAEKRKEEEGEEFEFDLTAFIAYVGKEESNYEEEVDNKLYEETEDEKEVMGECGDRLAKSYRS